MKHKAGRTYYKVMSRGHFCYVGIFDKEDSSHPNFAAFKAAMDGGWYTYEKIGIDEYRMYAAAETQHENDSINDDYERYGEWVGR